MNVTRISSILVGGIRQGCIDQPIVLYFIFRCNCESGGWQHQVWRKHPSNSTSSFTPRKVCKLVWMKREGEMWREWRNGMDEWNQWRMIESTYNNLYDIILSKLQLIQQSSFNPTYQHSIYYRKRWMNGWMDIQHGGIWHKATHVSIGVGKWEWKRTMVTLDMELTFGL